MSTPPRLIPARAGKTTSFHTVVVMTSAHPRAGGENDCEPYSPSPVRGSSPRGRGKRQLGNRGRGQGRLIPARAGKTVSWVETRAVASAHPRAGGENAAYVGDVPNDTGSSPRGRGKPSCSRSVSAPRGLIPARAGKTSAAALSASATWAHPRAGGENGRSCVGAFGWYGSSPRGRGKQGFGDVAQLHGRLIPARAGKTCVRRRAAWPTTAHPRAGGENLRLPFYGPQRLGSSPRGRGKLTLHALDVALLGLIPARAGKTGHLIHA